jgi:hypothetical protein
VTEQDKPIDSNISIADKYEPAMSITDQAEADAYLAACVEHTQRATPPELGAVIPKPLAEAIERANIGYFAGYYDNETRERVERLFRCEHPVFGSIAKNGPPTPEQVLAAGRDLGMALRKRSR